MNILFKTVIAFLIISTVSSCTDPELKKDMVEFDRAFIPAWYFAYMGDLDGAQKAMIPLMRVRKKFEKKHTGKFFQNGDWSESLRLTGAWLEEAECAMKDGDVQRSLVQLDHARYEMMDLRYLYGVEDYYLDAVWNLETTIAVAIETSKDLKLNLLEWEEYQDLSRSVESAWRKLLKKPFDLKEFDLGTGEAIALARHKSDLNAAIKEYLEAVETADGNKFEAAAKNMEPAYLNFLASFGDFENLRTFIAAVP